MESMLSRKKIFRCLELAYYNAHSITHRNIFCDKRLDLLLMSSVLVSTTIHQVHQLIEQNTNCLYAIVRFQLFYNKLHVHGQVSRNKIRSIINIILLLIIFPNFFSIAQNTFSIRFLPFPSKRVCVLIGLFEAYDSAVATGGAPYHGRIHRYGNSRGEGKVRNVIRCGLQIGR